MRTQTGVERILGPAHAEQPRWRFGQKAIAAPRIGLDQVVTSGKRQLRPQARYVDLHAVRFRIVSEAPHVGQQLLAGNPLARDLGKTP